jgi:outer membrane protein assembly factor BamE (lipoprotein component of BamABCDE complex)
MGGECLGGGGVGRWLHGRVEQFEHDLSGHAVSDVTLAQMEVGKTTKSWVVATLGAPTSVSQVDDNTELLRYTATRTTEREAGMIVVVASKQKTQKRETVYLEFKDGVLERYWKAEE